MIKLLIFYLKKNVIILIMLNQYIVFIYSLIDSVSRQFIDSCSDLTSMVAQAKKRRDGDTRDGK